MNVTPAQKLILEQLCEGKPPKAIAFDLGLSLRTVQKQIQFLRENNGARSSVQLVLMRLGLFQKEATI